MAHFVGLDVSQKPAVGYVRARFLTEGGCVAWVLRLVDISAEGEGRCADRMEISQPNSLDDLAGLGLTLDEGKQLLAGLQQ